MADLTQAERKAKEARTVAWLGRAIGVSSLGFTGVLTGLTSAQGPDTLLFQATHLTKIANYEKAPPSLTEVLVEVPVPSPMPPTHIPVTVYVGGGPGASSGGSTGGRGGSSGGSGGGYTQPVYSGPPAAQPVPGGPPAPVVHPPVAGPPPPQPAPTATSSGSVPH